MMKKLFLFLGALVLAMAEDLTSQKELMDHVLGSYKDDNVLSTFGEPKYERQSSNPDDIKFYLYNNFRLWNEFNEIKWDDENSVKSLPWIKGVPVKILIHGFTQSQNTSMPAIVKNAYLESMRTGNEMNVIVVDWGCLAARPDPSVVIYPLAVRHCEIAGRRIGEMIKNLKDWRIVNLQDVHIIGFSLGAHVAGWAGLAIRDANHGQRVGRISGLVLNWANQGRILKKDDADFVDIIHTSYGAYGIDENIGHVDFYPNPDFVGWALGGFQIQPRCFIPSFTKYPMEVCSHNMAPVFFAMSILREMAACKASFLFNAMAYQTLGRYFRCETSTAFIGEPVDPTTRGEYFIRIPNLIKEELEVVFEHVLRSSFNNSNPIDDLINDNNDFSVLELTPTSGSQVKAIKNLRKYPKGYVVQSGSIKKGVSTRVFVPRAKKLEMLMNLKVSHIKARYFPTNLKMSFNEYQHHDVDNSIER